MSFSVTLKLTGVFTTVLALSLLAEGKSVVVSTVMLAISDVLPLLSATV